MYTAISHRNLPNLKGIFQIFTTDEQNVPRLKSTTTFIVAVLFQIPVDILFISRAKVLGTWNLIKNYFTGEKV